MTSPSSTRNALVTGASAGLGLRFAEHLARAGYDLILVARREDRLHAVADRLSRETGRKCHIVVADLARPNAPVQVMQAVATMGLQVDYLVNNAGSSGPDLLNDRDWRAHEDFQRLMMGSVAQMCHLVAPAMAACGFGRIVNVASVAGLVQVTGNCQYAPSKAYVVALSRELAMRLESEGVFVSALCPGFTHTEFHAVAGTEDVKQRLPRWVWYDADTVVAEALKAVERRKSVFVSGRLYRWVVPLLQLPLVHSLVKGLSWKKIRDH